MAVNLLGDCRSKLFLSKEHSHGETRLDITRAFFFTFGVEAKACIVVSLIFVIDL
jgi:hypothetical protein